MHNLGGKERTAKTFREFFVIIGPEVSAKIGFICSDMWKPYLSVIREKCSQALNILYRFHIVAKVNEALARRHPRLRSPAHEE